jgi:antitoxin YefM
MLAIVVYMTIASVADARAHLSRLIDDAVSTHDRIQITRNGVPAAVLLSVEDYDSIMATIEVLSDQESLAAITADREDRVELSQDELDAAMRAAGRL